MKTFTKKDWILLSLSASIALGGVIYNQYLQNNDPAFHPQPLTQDEIKTLSNNNTSAVVIYPIFTQYAYMKNGFYDYYSGKCKTCTTVSMKPFGLNPNYNTDKNGFDTLMKLNYQFITDITVDKHPEILKDYDEVILLHNEYMTQKEFDAITSHKHVVYLYPNSAYAEVSVNYTSLKMTLVKGHQYPNYTEDNGFGFVTSSKNEYDTNCKNYSWFEMPNGIALSCYPEYFLTYDRTPMKTILDYPDTSPKLMKLPIQYYDLSDMRWCDNNGDCSKKIDDVLTKKP